MPHVRAFAEKLNALFAANFHPSDHLTLDEAIAAYKGRSPIKQYIPSKPHKWGSRFGACAVRIIYYTSKCMKGKKRVKEGKERDKI